MVTSYRMETRAHKEKTIVFIHGLFVTSNCWDEWKRFFEEQGYRCYAPAYPLKGDSPENLRKHIRSGKIETLRFEQILDSYTDFVSGLADQPILIGHSLGGLIVQLLLGRGLGSVGICVHSGPPRGVFSLKFSFLKSNLPLASPFADRSKPYLMPFEHWQYAFANGMSPEAQRAAYERYLVPESRQVVVDVTTDLGAIDFTKPHVPILFTAGTADHIIPASLNRDNWKRYSDRDSVTDFKEFEGRNHLTIGTEGWDAEAAYVASWLGQHDL